MKDLKMSRVSVVFLSVALLAAGIWLVASEKAGTVQLSSAAPGPHEHSIPREWGDPVAISSSAQAGLNTKMLFQASDGTLRIVVISGKKAWLEQVIHREEVSE